MGGELWAASYEDQALSDTRWRDTRGPEPMAVTQPALVEICTARQLTIANRLFQYHTALSPLVRVVERFCSFSAERVGVRMARSQEGYTDMDGRARYGDPLGPGFYERGTGVAERTRHEFAEPLNACAALYSTKAREEKTLCFGYGLSSLGPDRIGVAGNDECERKRTLPLAGFGHFLSDKLRAGTQRYIRGLARRFLAGRRFPSCTGAFSGLGRHNECAQ